MSKIQPESMNLKKCRIQFAYRLDPVDLASGYILGVQTEVDLKEELKDSLQARMSVDQMVAIGRARWEGRGGGLHYEIARCQH